MSRDSVTRAVVSLLLTATLLASEPSPRAANPQPYMVKLGNTANPALNTALEGSSQLISLRTTAPVSAFALVARARNDRARFITALQSFGYFNGQAEIRINGRPINDPNLVNLLEHAPASPPAAVAVTFTLGPQFRLGTVSLQGQVPPTAAGQLHLAPGEPAVAAKVLAAQQRLLSALRNEGYALAKVTLQPAVVHLAEQRMDVTFVVDTGPRVDIGQITLQGLHGMNPSFVRRRMLLRTGQQFSPDTIEAARADLASIPAFSYVRAQPAAALDAEGRLPITFQFGEAPVHAVDFGASYATDLGIGLTAGWHDRNLFGNAEQLNLTAAFQGGGNSQLRPGYKLNAQFLKPDFWSRDQTLEVNIGAVDQSLLPYTQKGLTESVLLDRKLSPRWSISYGVAGEQENIVQESTSRNYFLLMLPVAVRYDSTNSLLNPTHGIRAALTLTPTQPLTGSHTPFVITQLSASSYFDLTGTGRSVIAVRGLLGDVTGGGTVFDLPPDMRFYAGGTGTVRGYKYQSVGPQFPDGTPIGGTEITAASVELRQRVFKSWGITLFTDAAQVRASSVPSPNKYAVGVGAGVLYFTSIGPIRAQFAIPVVKSPNSGSFELYIGIGQAF